MARFHSRRKKKRIWIETTFILVFFSIVIFITYELSSHVRLASNNEEFLEQLLKESNHHMIYESSNHQLLYRLLDNVVGIDLNHPVTILDKTIGYQTIPFSNSSDDNIPFHTESNYIGDPSPKIVLNPRVYIYNTHQREEYFYQKTEDYQIAPNVQLASYMLREKLNRKQIPTLVETGNITDFLNNHQWNYNSSYKASRYYLTDALKKNPSLDLMIDLHRDAVKKEASTTTIGKKKYAKVLFVVGTNHPNYEKNLKLANTIHEKIKQKYPTLTRGVIKKSGQNVNGIYNQDVDERIILIECGGYENTIEEINNTLDILATVILEYLGGKS